jgi:hypothetical protein
MRIHSVLEEWWEIQDVGAQGSGREEVDLIQCSQRENFIDLSYWG